MTAHLPKVRTQPNPREKHQALPAAEDCVLPPELPLGQGLTCPQTVVPAGVGDCALWQADTIDEQAQEVFSSF